ncbi:MAG TPA: hypothetical protein VFK13_02170 [Gemmatimonadaceae bacterium]|nr:hypothetical protein [Gemmatimonadaceae bacterium]
MKHSMPSTTSTDRDDPILAAHFEALRTATAVESFPRVRSWLEEASRNECRQRARWRARSARIVRLLLRHPVRLAAASAVLAAACTIPVATDETLAYVISGRIAEPPAAARATLATLPWVNPEQLTVLGEVTWKHPDGTETVEAYVESGEAVVDGRKIITPTSKFALVLPYSDAREVEARARMMSGVKDVISAVPEPVQQKVRRPALKAALVAMELEFSTPLPDSAVERRIGEHLAGLRMSGVQVHYVTRRDGTRAIRLSGPGIVSGGADDARRIQSFIEDVQSSRAVRVSP